MYKRQELLAPAAAAAAAHAKDEAHQKKQRMKQIKNKKLEDKSKIHEVWFEDDAGLALVTAVSMLIVPTPPRPHKRNGDLWVEAMD